MTFDLRGHGRSGLVDGLPCYTASINDYQNDLLDVLQFAQERHVGMPSFLWAESMGGATHLHSHASNSALITCLVEGFTFIGMSCVESEPIATTLMRVSNNVKMCWRPKAQNGSNV
jgi:alpha-beta hydrolase superfamily lysophospholipase